MTPAAECDLFPASPTAGTDDAEDAASALDCTGDRGGEGVPSNVLGVDRELGVNEGRGDPDATTFASGAGEVGVTV